MGLLVSETALRMIRLGGLSLGVFNDGFGPTKKNHVAGYGDVSKSCAAYKRCTGVTLAAGGGAHNKDGEGVHNEHGDRHVRATEGKACW